MPAPLTRQGAGPEGLRRRQRRGESAESSEGGAGWCGNEGATRRPSVPRSGEDHITVQRKLMVC
jgi:hypothetical protein